MKQIVLTGGGTAGHVTPNIALIPELRNKGYEIAYIGSYDGIEKSSSPNWGSLTMGFLPANSAGILTLKTFRIRSVSRRDSTKRYPF